MASAISQQASGTIWSKSHFTGGYCGPEEDAACPKPGIYHGGGWDLLGPLKASPGPSPRDFLVMRRPGFLALLSSQACQGQVPSGAPGSHFPSHHAALPVFLILKLDIQGCRVSEWFHSGSWVIKIRFWWGIGWAVLCRCQEEPGMYLNQAAYWARDEH